jgi:hypothetical protein
MNRLVLFLAAIIFVQAIGVWAEVLGVVLDRWRSLNAL